MANTLRISLIAVAAVIFAIMAVAAIVSRQEGEPRAARRALFAALVLPLPYLLVGVLRFGGQEVLGIALLGIAAAGLLALAVPTGAPSLGNDTPSARHDERDIMFSRNLLEPGTLRFNEYYNANPDKKAADDAFRAAPGLLASGSRHYDPIMFSAAEASFATIERLRPFVEGEPAPERVAVDPQFITGFVKAWTKKLGAVSVGVTELQDYHLYTTVGRGPQYGQPVTLSHRFAVALTVEMDKHMLGHAPFGPTVMESAQQYLDSGAIALQLATFFRGLGYPARAHVDGSYRVICPLVAWDAGLGEIGRMGLLMTPELGPRVRIAVVTTDLPLVPDGRRRDPATIDFCTQCMKCADVCPSRAIPFDDRKEIDGVRRWRVDAESCFTLWSTLGTDCARCMAVCPYSHPDNALHNLVRRGIRHSSLFRRLAMKLDDVFYGKTPPPVVPAGWLAPAADR